MIEEEYIEGWDDSEESLWWDEEEDWGEEEW